MLITDNDEARALLSDPGAVPPPADDGPGALARLRSLVCRFSSGQEHAERREAVEQVLATLDPADLRRAAAGLRHEPAERVPALVLGAAFGVADLERLVTAVDGAARGYLSGERDREADEGAALLLELLDVPRATILLQAHAATGALIAKARTRPVEEVLRFDPPVRVLRRVGADIDVAAANREGPVLTFGYGTRPCPASAHALAIVEGALS
ncbi:hypothetical protein ACIBH1_20035 [Nonomuraea sp. NPDC050663]|uniref:hypothetical protein n=1 Tax=Nonomuraea sp. NPDC050663 TaxID=3364370 RepID=UPI0037B73175